LQDYGNLFTPKQSKSQRSPSVTSLLFTSSIAELTTNNHPRPNHRQRGKGKRRERGEKKMKKKKTP